MAEIMVRFDDLRRYCENRHCGSVPLEYIKQMPTIEAEPVRHGRWILCEDQHGVDNDNNNYAYFCSQCHYQDVHSKYAKVNFCWNCGADMREGDVDDG
jgi:hypothetical protein